MASRGKAERRFEEEKRKERTRRLIRDVWDDPERSEDGRFVGIEAGTHSRRCSCPMCRTSRRNPLFKGKSRLPASERRMLDDADSQLRGDASDD